MFIAGEHALLPCRSGSLPHYQKHDLFFGKLPKIAAGSLRSPELRRHRFLVIRVIRG